MFRVARLSMACTFAWAALALGQAPMQPAATPPAAGSSSEYFPLKTGNKWTYKLEEKNTLEVAVESVKDGEGVLVTKAKNRIVAKETIQVKADGIYRSRINDLEIKPPIKILALPAKKDASWDL